MTSRARVMVQNSSTCGPRPLGQQQQQRCTGGFATGRQQPRGTQSQRRSACCQANGPPGAHLVPARPQLDQQPVQQLELAAQAHLGRQAMGRQSGLSALRVQAAASEGQIGRQAGRQA